MSRSIQQLPNNSGTTSVTEVYTSTGFNAGDPVYFQNGDYKNPANLTAPSTVNFTFPETAAINPYGTGGIVAPSFTYADMQAGVGGGTARRFASVLTNGNIVQAWSMYNNAPTNNNRVHFRVITPTGTVVVAPTLVSSTYVSASYACVSVVALVGGGFAVGWGNSSGGTSNVANYAIYGNDGTVVTAATQDTSLSFGGGGTYCPLEMTALANGGFAIAVKDTSGNINLRAYSSTGSGSYAAFYTGIAATGNENSFALTSRSDSSVFVCDRISGTQYAYALFNTGGTAIVAATNFTIPSGVTSAGTLAGPDASVLTDGTTIVIGFNSNNGTYGYPAFRFLPTSNTISSETIAIPIANLFYQTAYNGGYLSVQSVSGGNFILYFTDGYGNMQYAFYNSSGTCLSGSNGTGAIPLQVTGGYCSGNNRVTLLESSGSVYAYWTPASNQQKPVQQFYCKISTSNYLVTPLTSIVGTPYTVSGITPSTITPFSNPNSVSFYSATNQSAVSTNTPATVSGPTAIASSTANSIASCALPNGNFVVVYKISSAITANVYSSAGAILATTSVGTGTTNDYAVKVAALSGGGFVVQYLGTATTTLNLAVYSSSYTLTTSTSFSIQTFSTQYNFDITGLQDNKFAIFYSTNGTNSNVRVYDSTLTVLQNISVATYSTMQGLSIAGNSYGGFGFSYFSASYGQSFFHSYVPTATNTWALAAGPTGTGAGSAFVQSPQMCATESGTYIFTVINSSVPSYSMFSDSGALPVYYVGSLGTAWPNGLGSTSDPTSYPMMGIGMTGNGNIVIATSYNSANIFFACLPSQMTFSNGQPLPFENTTTSNVPMFSNNSYGPSLTSTPSAQPRVTAGAGNNAIITFLYGASNYPAFIIINGTSLSNVYNITAGVTPSALTAIAPVATSGVISGAFAGVAITSATAGSTGQLATNGQALLGASYTGTASGAFDSTGGAVAGLKGTFNGRSVNLQGNS